MSDVANVTGTLDDNELNFSHSTGTTFEATTGINEGERDHTAVLTATDTAGNSVTETFVIPLSKSWSTPKTDWHCYTDIDGEYHGDRFNSEDFNRIKNNLAFLRGLACSMYPSFEINDLGEDREKTQYPYADEINQLEENITIIADNTFKPDYGTAPLFTANGSTFDFKELNRIESAILDLYNQLKNQYSSRRMFTFMLGVRQEVF